MSLEYIKFYLMSIMQKKDFQKLLAENKDDEIFQIFARIKNNPNFDK